MSPSIGCLGHKAKPFGQDDDYAGLDHTNVWDVLVPEVPCNLFYNLATVAGRKVKSCPSPQKVEDSRFREWEHMFRLQLLVAR